MTRNYRYSSELGVRNSRSTWHEVHVEPWANDYTLFPDEELVIIAYSSEAVPTFNLVESDGVSQVYCENTMDFAVFQKGVELECGHKRQPGSSA